MRNSNPRFSRTLRRNTARGAADLGRGEILARRVVRRAEFVAGVRDGRLVEHVRRLRLDRAAAGTVGRADTRHFETVRVRVTKLGLPRGKRRIHRNANGKIGDRSGIDLLAFVRSQLKETVNILGSNFLKERLQYGLYGLYPKYTIYMEPIIMLHSMVGHATIAALLRIERGNLADRSKSSQ